MHLLGAVSPPTAEGAEHEVRLVRKHAGPLPFDRRQGRFGDVSGSFALHIGGKDNPGAQGFGQDQRIVDGQTASDRSGLLQRRCANSIDQASNRRSDLDGELRKIAPWSLGGGS